MKLFRYLPLKLLVLVAVVSFAYHVNAQSDFDLEPPVQANLESNEVLMSPDPVAIPTFQFAVARIVGDELKISTASAKQTLVAVSPKPDPTLETYTEVVTQNYTVQIPYSEKLGDGTTVTKMRTETRTRSVPVTRTRKKKLTEKELAQIKADAEKEKKDGTAPAVTRLEKVQVPYTYSLPTQVMEDGVAKTVMKQTTQMRTQTVTRGKTETKKVVETEGTPLNKAKFYSVSGKAVDMAKVKKHLADGAGVILVKDSKSIQPYFESILQPSVLFVVVE